MGIFLVRASRAAAFQARLSRGCPLAMYLPKKIQWKPCRKARLQVVPRPARGGWIRKMFLQKTQRTMSQASFTSCDLSPVWSGASMRSAQHPFWKPRDVLYTHVLTGASSVQDAPLPPCSHLVKALHEETGLDVQDLQELESEGILQQIPRNDQGEISSIGSKKHSLGDCTPCIFWFRGICTKGLNCTYCHFRHEGQKSKRHKPNKRTRQALRELKLKNEQEEASEIE